MDAVASSAHRSRARRQLQRPRVVAAAAEDSTTTTRRRATKTRAPATSDALAATTTAATAPVVPIVANTLPVPSASVPAAVPIGVAVSTSTVTPVLSSASAVAASAAAGSSTSKLPTGGLVAIIVVCVLLGLAAVGFIAWRCVRRRNATRDAHAGGFGRSMAERRSSFGNNGNIPPIYAAHANHGANAAMLNRRSTGASDERKLLGRQPSPHGSEHDYDLKQPEGPYASPQPMQSAAFEAPQPKAVVAAGMFNQGAAAKSTANLYQPPPVAVAAAVPSNAAPPTDAAAVDGQTIYVVKRTFEPSLPDELVLFVGDKVIILQSFDDGWCLGANLSSSAPGQDAQRGVFPRDCVEEANPKPAGATGLSRAPTLPPLDIPSSNGDYFGNASAPAIQVSGPDGRAKHVSAADVMLSAHYDDEAESPSSVLNHFPEPASRQANGLPVKRTSSLIADRDAQLVMALGTALERS